MPRCRSVLSTRRSCSCSPSACRPRRRERDAMQPLTITATTPYANRLSLQANLKDYARIAEIFWAERQASLAETNARLADNLVSINGKLEFPREFVLNRLAASV